MVSPITIGRWVSALPSRADTASNGLTPLMKGRSQISVTWRMAGSNSTTLIWIIKSPQMPHGVSTQYIGRAIMRMERPQPPSNGLTTAIGRWVTLASLPMSIDGEVSTALINIPSILITRVEFKNPSTACDIELQECQWWRIGWHSSWISRRNQWWDSSSST